MVDRCEFTNGSKGTRCPKCGYELRSEYRFPPVRPCSGEHSISPATEMQVATDLGLGDYTESLLRSIGVTKERYIAAKELFGFAPTCHCEARKEWLNHVSDWWNRTIAGR